MAETNTPVMETAAPAAPAKKPVKRKDGRRKVRNTIILLIVLAALAVGGWFLFRFLNSGGGEQGEIFSMYTDRRLGTTFFCVSPNQELYPIPEG